ncbi:MAG: hypothetical protein CM15mP19_00220 [Gammaproteobacteria bacterium]|nr:MAG: hypothetical protein CM15mP19_00220 [Gammaproteobacteria bacterium]
MVKNNNVVLAGEITTIAEIDYEQIARSVVKDIGYDHDGLGLAMTASDLPTIFQNKAKT